MNKKEIIKAIKNLCPIELDTKKLNTKSLEELEEYLKEIKEIIEEK